MRGKMVISLLLMAILVLPFVPTAALAEAGYSYIDENGDIQTTGELVVTPVTADTATLPSGWYVVNSDVTRDGTITVSGSAHLILVDGYTLTVTGNDGKAGISVLNSNSLTIYGQSAGTGTLSVRGGQYGAGIGGTNWELGGTINICGGTIRATGGQYGAGIGGGYNANAGTTMVSGGTVTATGGENGAGIGGGYSNVVGAEFGTGGTIIITGGDVTANGNRYGAGIGGGSRGRSGMISISGGVVNATSGDVSTASGAAGIGGGVSRGADRITISGGTVIATAPDYGAGIGGGDGGGGGVIEITGGHVTASSRYGGAGIGGGWGAGGDTTTISGGTVAASSGYGGAGIGGGMGASSGVITIHGGHITAYGGAWGAGIGGGGGSSCNTITITGGIVFAIGDYNDADSSSPGGAGIGSGGANSGGTQRGGTIRILGGKVTARSAICSYSEYGLDIGRGRNGINGTVLIGDEAIVSLNSRGIDASVTTLGTCVIKGTGAGVQMGVYEDGARLDAALIDLESPTLLSSEGYTVTGDTVTLTDSGNAYALVGSTTSRKIVVSSGVSVDVTLFAADIAPASGCAFDMTGATVNMRSISDNALSSSAGFAGIQAPSGSTLTISGSGSLTATGGSNGAGIGGGSGMAGGSISFTGGAVEAVGNGGGAGVGGGNGSDGGAVLVDGENTTLTAIGGANGFDIGSGNSQIIGGSLTIQNHATVLMTRNGTNANENYITGTVGGAGSQLDAGQYLNSYKLLTCTEISASPATEAKAFDYVTLTAHVTGLSDTRARGQIVFYDNGSEIGRTSLNREAEGSASAMAVLHWTASGGTHALTTEYVQDEGWDSYYLPEAGSLGYEVARIEQAALSIAGVPATVTYGDAPFVLTVSGGNGSGSVGYAVTQGDAVSVNAATGVVTVAKAGSATVTVTKAADNDYNEISGSVHIAVNKATPPAVVFPSSANITYGQTLSQSALTGDSGDGTFVWESPDTIPPVHNTGYTVIFTPNDIENYDYTGVTLRQTVNVTVNKATPTVPFPTAGEITYGQSLAICTLTGGSGDGSFAWEDPDTIPTVVNSGYNMIFMPNDTDNYIEVTQAVAVPVRKADQSPLSITEPSVTYGDAPFPLSVSGGNGSGSFSYAIAAGEAVLVNASTGIVTVVKAGTATVMVTKAADSNYNATDANVTFTVGKATPVVVFPTATAITYGQPLSDSVLTGGSGDGDFEWESPNTNPVVVNNGYTVVFTPGDTENYTTMERTVALIVYKAVQTPLTVNGIPDTLTFGDAPFGIVVDGGSGTGTLRYAVVSGEAVAVDAEGSVTITHAGAAAVNVTNPGDDNYLPASHAFLLVVNKAAQATPLTFELPDLIAYGDAPFQILGSGGSGTGAWSYLVASGDAVAVSSTGVVTVLRPGDAIITAVKAGDADYLSQTTELRLSVNKGVQNALTLSGIPARVFTGHAPFVLAVSGGSGDGALRYTVASGNAVSMDENGAVTILRKGTALLSVTKAEDEYYMAATATAEIYVRQAATATQEAPAASPTPSASPSATAVPSPTPTATTRPSTTDEPPSQTDSPVSVMLRPLSAQYDEKTDKIVVVLRTNDLPEGTAAIRLPSHEFIRIDNAQNTLEVSVSPGDINGAGELVLVVLNEERTPMGSYLIDLSDDAWRNDATSDKPGLGPMLLWIAAAVLVIGGAVTALIGLKLRKK